MWYKNAGTTFLRFVRNHAFEFDRQTDRQTEFSSLDRVYIPCSAAKIDADVDVYERYVTV